MAITQEEHLERCGSLSAYKQGVSTGVSAVWPVKYPNKCLIALATFRMDTPNFTIRSKDLSVKFNQSGATISDGTGNKFYCLSIGL